MKTLPLWGTVTPLSFRATTRNPAFKLFSKLLTVFGIAMMFAISGWASNNPTVSLSCTPNTLMEGNSGTQTVTCTISLDQAPDTNQIKIKVVSSGTATTTTDYTGPSDTTFSFAKDTTTLSQTFTYSVKGDTAVETDETIIATLADNGTNTGQQTYTFSNSAKTITVYTDDFSISSSNHRAFTQIYNTNDNGNIKIIGNSVLTTSSGCQTGSNNDYDAVNAGNDANSSTFNSTSSDLNLSSVKTGSDILYAGLYWQGRFTSAANLSSNAGAARTVKLKLPGSEYQTVTSEYAKFNWSTISGKGDYQGVLNITQLLQANVNLKASSSTGYNQTIWVADVKTDTGSKNLYGAWSIVLVYKDGTTTFKNLSVYDGYLGINTGTSLADRTVALSGFLTPSTYPVNSNFLIFGGEGDKYYGDSVTLSNSSGDQYLNPNDIHEVFSASVTDESGNNVTTRSPACPNTMGADIHSYSIGKTSSSDTIGIIETDQTSTTVKLSSFTVPTSSPWPPIASITDTRTNSYDTFFPGVFAFATDLYQPNMCYVEEIFNSADQNISGVGKKVNKDDILKVRVTVKNNGTDVAKGVQVLNTFNDSSFPYVANSTYYENLFAHTRVHGTDSAGDDLFEYNASKVGRINLGDGATVSGGGDFVPIATNSNAYAIYEYNGTVKILDQNFSNDYYAAYKSNIAGGLDYSNNPVKMEPCTGVRNSFWGYSAPQLVFGNFNVVYADHANGALSSGYYYNLPTQITSRADNYKVLALQSGNNILKDVNATVAVELVNADSSGNCSSMTPISNRVWVLFDDDNVTDFSGDVIAKYYDSNKTAATSTKDNEFYQKAGKNVVFRTSWNTNASNNMIPLTKLGSGQYKLTWFPNYAQGQQCGAGFVSPVGGSNQITTWCGSNGAGNGENGMTQSELFTCMECIFGIYTQKVCSQDNFAIRPEAFFVKLNDQNQTNSATKQFMMNNAPSPANENMASGYRYYMEVNATNHLDTNSSFDYNTSENIDFVWNSTQTGCNDDTNKSIAFNFVNGLADGNVSVDQVGEYRLSIIDTAWTAVDSNTSLMTHHTAPYFIVGTPDCTVDSTVSSAVKTTGIGANPAFVGCNISTDHTNTIPNPDITYTDSNVTFRPYKFDMSTINFGVGLQPQEINATSGPDFVYMSDMSRTDSMNMSVRATGTISARGENNSTLSNFVDNCYAVNTNLSMNTYNNITLANTDYQVRFVDSNGSGTVYDSNATNVVTSALAIPLMTLDDGNFTKDMSGSLNTVTRLNYDRNQTTPLNPMSVQYEAFGFKCVTASECTMQADLSASHEAIGSRAMDFNVTHIYGRIIPRDVRVFGNVAFVVNAWYEGYNTPTLNGASLAASKIDAMWYVNNVHNDTNDGDGNVTVIIPTLTLPTHSSSTAGMETYQFAAVPLANIPYGGKAHINTDPWLWYGINALGYADPVDSTNLDCLTHPCFNITVVPSIGATGSAKSTNESTKASKKTDSGGGTWKSTSDYAPAIR